MRSTKTPRSLREKRRRPELETCERRDLMAADTLGVFAMQAGIPAAPNTSVSQPFEIDRSNFRLSQTGTVMLRVTSDEFSNLGPLSVNTTRNPVHGKAVPSVWQRTSTPGFLLTRARAGAYVLSAGYSSSGLPSGYEINYQLAGDVDGSFDVTHEDFALIRSAIFDPSSVTPEQFANADVDGNGTVNQQDLRLARANFGAATSIRPTSVRTAISGETPHNGAVIRVDNAVITAWTTPGARVIFSNVEYGQQVIVTADANGYAEAAMAFPVEAANQISVMVQDGAFGQSATSELDVIRRPTPVVILPGYTSSLPKSASLLQPYLMNLGFPADELAVVPEWVSQFGLISPYLNLQQMLENDGYAMNVDQFIVPYDWRIPIAPYDGVQDGVLSLVTGTSITQAQPQYSLGYFGNFLKKMVIDDPSIVNIDLIGHSNGGLMTRAYIQSLAYGATVTENGRTFTLPKVQDAVLMAAPSMGAAEAFPIWNNDLESFTLGSTSVLRLLLAIPYSNVLQGQVVTSPLGNIDLAAITDPNTGQPDPLKFLRLYGASLRDLNPTYDFLLTTGGVLTNINNDPASANYTVLDMNATSSPGVNPWTALVDSATATFGVYSNINGNPVQTVTQNQTVVADGTTGQIWPFQEANPIVPPAGTIYYNDIPMDFGDGTVPYVSQIATYAGDSSIFVKQWGNGTSQNPPSWTQTIGVVLHSPYLNNSDVLELVRKRLAGLTV
jgi:hypothetical protein